MKLLNIYLCVCVCVRVCVRVFPQVLLKMAWRRRKRSVSLRRTSSWPKKSSRRRKTLLLSLRQRTWAAKTWSTSAIKVSTLYSTYSVTDTSTCLATELGFRPNLLPLILSKSNLHLSAADLKSDGFLLHPQHFKRWQALDQEEAEVVHPNISP